MLHNTDSSANDNNIRILGQLDQMQRQIGELQKQLKQNKEQSDADDDSVESDSRHEVSGGNVNMCAQASGVGWKGRHNVDTELIMLDTWIVVTVALLVLTKWAHDRITLVQGARTIFIMDSCLVLQLRQTTELRTAQLSRILGILIIR